MNLWLALVFEAHYQHSRALTWFDSIAPNSCYFCRITQAGFLRLSTNASVFKEDALTMKDAWRAYDTLLSDERLGFVQEPYGLEPSWRKHTMLQSHSSKRWMDGYLAGLAEAANFRVVTFDRAFASPLPEATVLLG